MEILKTACPLDCPDACSLDVTVEDGRVTQLDGNHVNGYTEGYICSKVRRFPEHVYGEERILSPAVRVGPKGSGEFRDVTWDEALTRITEEMKEARSRYGGESILPVSYGGSNGFLSQDTTDARLFTRIGASQLARTVCAAPSGAALQGLYGKMLGVAFEDYVHANLIVLWGINPSASGIHVLPYIKKARERGAKLVVIDPRRHRLARNADIHLAPRPGTDLPLALSLARWLNENGHVDREFLAEHATGADRLLERAEPWTLDRAADVTGLSRDSIEEVARLYAETSPAVIRSGWGHERNRNGGSAVAAGVALPALAGKFGVRGGGFTASNGAAWSFDPLRAAGVNGAAHGEREPRTINMNRVGRVLLEENGPPVKVLFAYNCNPLAILPRQDLVEKGMAREDLFTVVYDQVLTDSARYADVILPATTFLEHRELRRGYGSPVLQEGRPVIKPVGESRPNLAVFGELCQRMGVQRDGEAETEEEMTEALLEQTGRAAELRRALDEDGIGFPEGGIRPVQFEDVFPLTSDGKIHLFPEELDREAPDGLYVYQEDPATQEHPLALISPATGKTISSTFGQLDKGQIGVEISARDAERRGITDGCKVSVFNEFGEVQCLARISDEMTDGVVFLPKGIWCHNTLNGRTSNALSPDTYTDLGGGACFNDARVEVRKLD